ncbi:flagellar motor switch protein FliN [Bacterioplanes sanyensis]|uniref:Flagellar motor switch protein FliN n=1 Tax=Bacterioplanes sanyensis TaxID=1249553 RepID=A0A222FQA5_9GAMM|nr:flagellar motor switch protein FliN [Bacterioplanes sanyensis]ASP40581.1 flagellar motor switch protein FliN [Bacterioplanes sanyensis]
MADENDVTPDEPVNPDELADSVASGIEEAGEDEAALADEWAAAMAESGDDGDGDVEDDWAAAMQEEAAASEEPQDNVEPAPLDPLQDDSQPSKFSEDGPELDVILDIPVRISMEVGSTQIPIRNLLQLNQGSVVELDRLAGEPLDVMVNGTLIAHGEVVMVNDKFGIRLTDVVSQSERIQRLR